MELLFLIGYMCLFIICLLTAKNIVNWIIGFDVDIKEGPLYEQSMFTDEENAMSDVEYIKHVNNGLDVESTNNPLEVVIKNQEINIKNHNIEQKSMVNINTLADYIGQEKNKKVILKTIKVIKMIKPINIFLHGYPGCGKSTLGEIIAAELKSNFIYTIPEQLKNVETINSIIENIQSSDKLTVWMIDEIHNIDKKTINILLPILQSYRLGNVNIKQFVLIGATTDYNKLYYKSEALISRFQTKINMDRYTVDELVKILRLHKDKMNVPMLVSEDDLLIIAKNSKGVPREAINLLLKLLVSPNAKDVLAEHKIIKNGINDVDVRILNSLNVLDKPIGANYLSMRVGLLQEDYNKIYEPYLIKIGFIERTARGRQISKTGKEFLTECAA